LPKLWHACELQPASLVRKTTGHSQHLGTVTTLSTLAFLISFILNVLFILFTSYILSTACASNAARAAV